jgi:hypothetical protein
MYLLAHDTDVQQRSLFQDVIHAEFFVQMGVKATHQKPLQNVFVTPSRPLLYAPPASPTQIENVAAGAGGW